MENQHENEGIIVNEDDVEINSFKAYPSSEDDTTKIVDGEVEIEDFHLYHEDSHDKELDDEEHKDIASEDVE